MKILQTRVFKKSYKKLHSNQKADLDAAIRIIINDPQAGTSKTGDLSDIRVYKFHMIKQMTLLAYTFDDQTITLTLLALGSHENFYRDLKNRPA